MFMRYSIVSWAVFNFIFVIYSNASQLTYSLNRLQAMVINKVFLSFCPEIFLKLAPY